MHIHDEEQYELLTTILEPASQYSDEPGKYDLADFISAGGDPLHALLYAAVFCPPFVEIDGMVFQYLVWPGPPEKAIDEVRRVMARSGNKQRVERYFNFVDITRLFPGDASSVPREAESLLASLIATTWAGTLKVRFPDRLFRVEVHEPEETGEEGVGVIFYELS